jgi:VIT1/CCC1 family predicted Fe2+/Mn2+ transporter
VLASLSERGRNLRLFQFIRAAGKPEGANRVISEALPPAVASILTAQEIDGVRQRLINLPDPPSRAGVTADDVKGALGVCILVFSSCLPLIVPFVFIKEPLLALRVSNAIALVSLFLAGYFLAQYAGFRKLRTGIAMMVLGVVLVAITIQLGG